MTDAIRQALRDVGARLKRNKKHLVYELPNGRNVVVANTPSDSHAEQNSLHEIRRVAGVERPVKPTPKTKRGEKPGRQDTSAWSLQPRESPLATALRESGLVEQQLRQRIRSLEASEQAAARYRDAWHEAMAKLDALRRTRWYRWGRFLRLLPDGRCLSKVGAAPCRTDAGRCES